MENEFIAILLLSILCLTGSVVNAIVNPRGNASYESVQAIKLGSPASSLAKKLGKPDLIDSWDNSLDTWTYNEKYNSDSIPRVEISVDTKKHVVTDIMSFIYEGDPEAKFEFVKSQFPRQKFTAYQRPKCKCMEYQPVEVDYINANASVAITVDGAKNNLVESVDWGAPGTMKPITCDQAPKKCDWAAIFGEKAEAGN